jgi:hypothetical protein
MSAVILRCYDFPARIPGHLFVSLPEPTLPSSVRVSQLALALPEGRRMPSGPRSLFNRRPELPVCSHVDVSGTSQVPRRSILCLCPVLRPRPNRRSLAYLTVSSMLPPLFPRQGLQRLMNFGALSRGFSTCCLRFKNDVATIHAKLASGWLARLYREGVEPSGSLQKVSDHTLVPLFWIYPGAREVSSHSHSCRRQSGEIGTPADGSCDTDATPVACAGERGGAWACAILTEALRARRHHMARTPVLTARQSPRTRSRPS